MIENLIDSFPDGATPHPQQTKILNNIEQAFNEGYNFVIVSAPTGVGKSYIAKTLGNHATTASKEFQKLITSNMAFKSELGDYKYAAECYAQPPFGAMMLTITKSLQDQYVNEFGDIRSMKGKSNYTCAVDDEYTVDMAPCVFLSKLKVKCQNEFVCPYYNARIKALIARSATLNYKMFFSLPPHVKQREYIICDEASELEDELVKQFTCTINFSVLKKLGIELDWFPTGGPIDQERWAQMVMGRVYDRMEDYVTMSNAKGIDKKEKDKYKQFLVILRTYHNSLATLIETFHHSDYQYEKTDKMVNFIPLKVDRLAKFLFDCGKKIVLMSATIIDHENYAKSLGVTNYKYIEVDSPFDAKKAPIKCSTMFNLSYKNIDQCLPKIIEQVEMICDFHKDEKGIIHTHSAKITAALQGTFILDNRFLYREQGVSNEQIIDIHNKTKDPTVLVSPSMSFGVDLKGDLARFQILVKAPFAPMQDIRIKKMFEMDKQWYTNKMLSSVIQACGRGVRSKSDECVTYILDGTITRAILQNKSRLPKYFLDRFQ